MERRTGSLAALLVMLATAAASCTIETDPSVGVRTDGRGRAVIMAPVCTDERIEAVQVTRLDGGVLWRVEGGGNGFPAVFVVGRTPQLMREVDPLEGELDPDAAYVATVEYAGSRPDVDVEFRLTSLSTDVVVDDDGDIRSLGAFLDEADFECLGDAAPFVVGILILVVVGFLAAVVVGLVIVVRVVRKARRARELDATPDRPDLSGR